MGKKLATIRKVTSTMEMEGFDNVYLAFIDGWQAIVKKNEVKKDDIVVFIEPGALCPDNETFHFLEKKHFKVKTMKLKGYLSQGLIMPLSILNNTDLDLKDLESLLNKDVTCYLDLKDFTEQVETIDTERIKKNTFIGFLMKHRLTRWLGRLFLPKKINMSFPSHLVSKTDEERIQNNPHLLNITGNWVMREKVDGMSGTWIVERKKKWYGKTYFEFYCCSRNYRLNEKYDKNKPYFKLAEKYKLKQLLTQYLIDNPYCKFACLQGECIGEKIQGNPYKIKDYDLYLFNFIVDNQKISCFTAIKILNIIQTIHDLPKTKFAPLIKYRTSEEKPFDDMTVSQVLEFANGKSMINENTIREGIVVRNYEKNISFKVVSPEYLIKKGE